MSALLSYLVFISLAVSLISAPASIPANLSLSTCENHLLACPLSDMSVLTNITELVLLPLIIDIPTLATLPICHPWAVE